MDKNSSADTGLNSSAWTIERLKQLETSGRVKLFKTLPAPCMREMDGEYRGYYLGVDNHLISNLLWHITANLNIFSGVWQGKSFQPISDTEGSGFNNLKKFGMLIHRWPMRTSIGKSRYDDKDVFSLNYRYYYSLAGIASMHDEIRKVSEGLYLGIGHWRLPIGIPMASVWFALTGPVGPFDATGGRL